MGFPKALKFNVRTPFNLKFLFLRSRPCLEASQHALHAYTVKKNGVVEVGGSTIRWKYLSRGGFVHHHPKKGGKLHHKVEK